MPEQCAKLVGARRGSELFDPAIPPNDFDAEGSEPRPTTTPSSRFRFDHGTTEAAIHRIDEQPRAGLAGMICFLHPASTHGVLIEYAQPFPEDAHR